MRLVPYGAAMLVATIAFASTAQAVSTADYVKAAGAGDLYEQRSSALVLASTRDARIKMIAKMMIADHAKSTKLVTEAAIKAGMHPAPMLDARQQGMIADLEKANGADRDALYLNQQKAAHDEALALHTDYAVDGSNPDLREVAGKIAPVVKHHIEMVAGAN